MESESEYANPAPLPPQMKFSQLIERSAPATIQEREFSTTNGSTFSPANSKEMRFAVQVAHGTFVDPRHSYFSFDVEMKVATVTASKRTIGNIDGGVVSLIQDIAIIGSDGAILERITNQNLIAQALKCVTAHKATQDGMQAITEGSNGTAPNLGCQFLFDNTGSTSATANMTQTKRFNFTLNTSALLNSDKYLPLGFLQGSALSISLTLADDNTALSNVSTASGSYEVAQGLSYQVRNATYNASCITYDSATTSLFTSLLQEIGGVQIHGVGVQQLGTNSIPAGAGTSNHTISLPCRNRSTIALVHLMHDSVKLVSQTRHSISERTCRLLSEYSHSIGGVRYPIADVTLSTNNPAQGITEIQKVFYNMGDVNSGGLLHNGVDSTAAGDAGTFKYYPTSDVGCGFLVMQGFQSAPGSGMESGLDLSSQSSNVDYKFKMTSVAASSSAGATNISSYSVCDQIFTFTASGVIVVSS